MTGWTTDELVIVWLSLKVATVATLASAIPAVGVAWLLARGRFWGRTWLNVLVHLPLVVPPVVTGYVLLLVFGRRGTVGRARAAPGFSVLVPLDGRRARRERHVFSVGRTRGSSGYRERGSTN